MQFRVNIIPSPAWMAGVAMIKQGLLAGRSVPSLVAKRALLKLHFQVTEPGSKICGVTG